MFKKIQDLDINWKCFIKAVVWFVSNFSFGLAPLLVLIIVNPFLIEHPLSHGIVEHIKSGIVFFVCCALMGAVIIDILIEKIVFTKIAYFAFNVCPFIVLGIVCFTYLMVLLNHMDVNVFATFSGFYKFVLSFTILYCILGKYFLYESSEDE